MISEIPKGYTCIRCPKLVKRNKHLSLDHWKNRQHISWCAGCTKKQRGNCQEFQDVVSEERE